MHDNDGIAQLNKRHLSTTLAKYVVNPMTKVVAGYIPWWSLLETTGRKSGVPRRTPVGNGLKGDVFWIVAEHGRKANYVRNIIADPHVRVRLGGRWREGTAHLMPDDDPRVRQQTLGRGNAALVRFMGTDLLTIRIDLD